ncbi:hypothetical protein [Accumulibacter sp.]|uniref:hypothetical protein n=1 Tax=Accumulibacter sp. TaxID=2053492 RepID=UPI002624429D|nr:hypothetical protein [Accumulibacter sp.]
MNNNQQIISQLREQLDCGLSVHSVDAIIQTCKGFLSSNSAQPDDLLLPVFALKAVFSSVKHIADDEGFPVADKLAALEQRFWPILKRCVDGLECYGSEQTSKFDLALTSAIRELF